MERKIIHIDMDAFFASVEQRDHLELRGKAVAVGGHHERGVVAAASYEARKFGVRSAMPSMVAARKCPGLIFVAPRIEVYKSVSEQIQKIFYEYTDLVEPLSIDEAFLDVSYPFKGPPSATLIAKEIKNRIQKEIHLTASAGVSYNKFLAKIASDMDKPNGLYVIPPGQGPAFIEKLPIEKFFGIGKVTAEKFHKLGVHSGSDLKQWSQANLIRLFGKVGAYYYQIARGIDDRPVNPFRIRKSIGAEHTFMEDLGLRDEMVNAIGKSVERVARHMNTLKVKGRTVTLKVKYADFQVITRSKTPLIPVSNETELLNIALELLYEVDISHKAVRLLGVSVSNLVYPGEFHGPVQLEIDFEWD